MDSQIKTKKINIDGMTCINCQERIKKKLANTAGISKVDVSYSTGSATISYDADIISLQDIGNIIQKLNYKVVDGQGKRPIELKRMLGLVIITVSLYIILDHLGLLTFLAPSFLAEANMGYGALFVIGLTTSVHCVAMCGGLNISQCISVSSNTSERHSILKAPILYNFGRVLSYTIVGFIVGAIGSIVSFSLATQGLLKLVAGIFMVIMGINMLGVFPWFRIFAPRMPAAFFRIIDREKTNNKSPFIVGIFNGLMPCGPLQAMQIYALSTGDPIKGALSMMIFSLGTVPLVFGVGVISSSLGRKFTQKTVTIGAVLVVVLGFSMLSQGWSLSGFSAKLNKEPKIANNKAVFDSVMEGNTQVVKSTLSARKYPNITVQTGAPVKWIIDAPAGSINGCNNKILISEYGLEHTFSYGENVIEFTASKAGTYRYSCWMGMIHGTIRVIDP